MQRSLTVFFLLCIFASCKKKGMATGRVTSVFDGAPMEGVLIHKTYSGDAYLTPSAGWELPAVTSDANGDFIINAKYSRRPLFDYNISLLPNENYVSGYPQQMTDTSSETSFTYWYFNSEYRAISSSQSWYELKKKRRTQHYEFQVAPCARIKFVATNVAPFNADDAIYVDTVDENFETGYESLFSQSPGFPPEIGYKSVPTGGTIKLRWKVRKKGQENLFYDTVALPAFKKLI
jgi:hypothetical protein